MATALQQGTWMEEKDFKKTCNKEKKNGTWVADFILRQDAGRFMLEKYLSDKKISWKRRR